jgi:hypothetical protein
MINAAYFKKKCETKHHFRMLHRTALPLQTSKILHHHLGITDDRINLYHAGFKVFMAV